MKVKLIKKNSYTQEIICEKEYTSLRQIASDLNVTYCSVYKNFQHNFDPDVIKKGKKLSQVLFDKEYTVIMC